MHRADTAAEDDARITNGSTKSANLGTAGIGRPSLVVGPGELILGRGEGKPEGGRETRGEAGESEGRLVAAAGWTIGRVG